MNEEYEYVVKFKRPWNDKALISRTKGTAALEKIKQERHGLKGRPNRIISVHRVPLSAYEEVTDF